jgi:hypothetical protein
LGGAGRKPSKIPINFTLCQKITFKKIIDEHLRFFETIRLSLFSLGFEMDLKKLPKCPSNIIHGCPCKVSTSSFDEGHLFGPQITPKRKLITLHALQ